MEGFPPSRDGGQRLVEEAANAASSTPQHAGARFRGEPARDEEAVIVPFRRAVPANGALPPDLEPVSPARLVTVPVDTGIPDHARRIIAHVMAGGAPKKNVSLMPGETDELVHGVLAALKLADLYRLAMGDPAAVKKTGELIVSELDKAAIRRIGVLVLYAENKDDLDDPIVHRRVTAIVTETRAVRARRSASNATGRRRRVTP